MKKRLDWQPYVNRIASEMRLGHWRMEVLDEAPDNPDALATIFPWHGRFAAHLYFGEGFLNGEAEEQRYTVVHELVHCHFAHADKLVREDLSADTREAFRLASEYAVDAMAMTIAPFMPLPPVTQGG